MEQNSDSDYEKIELACKAAAEAIKNADIMLLATGAGFSADSGLAVYKDIADVPAYHKMNLNYMQLCNPSWLRSQPEIFYGFWGSCFNSYRDTNPHDGYGIVKKWKNQFFADKSCRKQIQEQIKERSSSQFVSKSLTLEEQMSKLNLKTDPLDAFPGAFFVYTSNVDNHSIKCGFNPNEVFEIHGTTENWQCSKTCISEFWQAPKDFKFQIDLDAMKAEKTVSKNAKNGWKSNFPTCIHCDSLARPAVLMFGDSGWVDDPMQTRIYTSWKLAVTNMLAKDEKLKLVILEIGAGTNVPTVRYQSESYCDKLDPKQCTLIRINPDFPNYEGRNASANVISIQTKGLEALVKIDSFLNK